MKIKIDGLTDAVMQQLNEYADTVSDDVKDAVQKSAKAVKEQIKNTAPRRTGKYAKSWAVKKTSETSQSLQLTVHSRNRYQLTHLLEFGHAKRGGGRAAARPHIAPAEQAGIELLDQELKRRLRHG